MKPLRALYRAVFKRSYQFKGVCSSQLWATDQYDLVALAKGLHKNPLMVEIGAWCGQTALILGSVALVKDGHLFSIDTFDGRGSILEGYAKEINILEVFTGNMVAADLCDVVRPVVGLSDIVAEAFPLNTVDFVFVDGDHRYAQVKKDITEWLKRVRPGGRICGHDYDGPTFEKGHEAEDCDDKGYHHGVVRAVNELLPEHRVKGKMWYYDKPVA